MPQTFDVSEKAPETTDQRKNVVRKNVQPKATGKLGEIAHYHKKENEYETWDEPCLYVSHHIDIPGGIDINDDNYKGTVIVAQCAADQFASMESAWKEREAGIFRNRAVNKIVASY